jgi:hypothetical protein
MKKLFLIFFVAIGFICNAQSISGEWYGWANFDGHPDENNYMISFNLDQRGEQIEGQMSLYYMDEFRTFNIIGLFDQPTQTLLITHVDIPVHFLGLRDFGKVDIDMFLSSKIINSRQGSQMKGFLTSKTFRTINNLNFSLSRPPNIDVVTTSPKDEIILIPQKKLLIKEEITVFSDSVYIDLYDGSIIDGDSVNVYLNHSKILTDVLLTADPIRFSFPIKEVGSSVLVTLEAINLGSITPNTGVMIVKDGEFRKVLYFASSFDVSCSFLFSKGAR